MTLFEPPTDVVVVGAGVVGCAVAHRLAASGISTCVVDRGRPASEASWAAAGMLSPQGEAEQPGPFLDLVLRSLTLWPDWLREVEEASGQRVEYRAAGKLIVALDADDEAALRARLSWPAAPRTAAEWIDPAGVAALEPALTADLRGALRLPGGAGVDNRALGEALWRAAGAAGCRFDLGEGATGLLVEGGAARGVVLARGRRIPAARVVVAAGAWSGALGGLPRALPVRPVKGQMLALSPPPVPLQSVLQAPGVYLVPRGPGPGRILAGATVEEAGFDRTTSGAALARLRDAAVRVVPGLRDSTVLESWAGLRPGTPDDHPILGPDPEMEGLLYATGHYRNGILLAPVTAELLAAAVAGENAVPPSFRPGRFGVNGAPRRG